MSVQLDQTYSEANGDSDAYIHYTAALADEISQGFTPSISGEIPYIDLWIKKLGSPVGNISLEIRNDSAGVPGATVHATSNAIDASTISTSYSKVRFTFGTPYSVTASTVYHMATLVTYSLSTGTNNIVWLQDTTSPSYSGGQDAFLNSGTWTTNSRDNIFDQYVTIPESSSVSASSSRSASASSSASSSRSLSPSSSASRSSSASLSPSSSGSASASGSGSASASASSSSSGSASLSPSSSTSASVSASPSVGYNLYTRGDEEGLPTGTADLETFYTDAEVVKVNTRNDIRVGQTGARQYMLHQFKVFVGDNTSCTIEWEGQSSLAPNTQT